RVAGEPRGGTVLATQPASSWPAGDGPPEEGGQEGIGFTPRNGGDHGPHSDGLRNTLQGGEAGALSSWPVLCLKRIPASCRRLIIPPSCRSRRDGDLDR